eukprot:m.189989 g.189989  ORF g.189989 m.189989 type:complete len:243 (+) comp53620_c0_seq1:171-899(+)
MEGATRWCAFAANAFAISARGRDASAARCAGNLVIPAMSAPVEGVSLAERSGMGRENALALRFVPIAANMVIARPAVQPFVRAAGSGVIRFFGVECCVLLAVVGLEITASSTSHKRRARDACKFEGIGAPPRITDTRKTLHSQRQRVHFDDHLVQRHWLDSRKQYPRKRSQQLIMQPIGLLHAAPSFSATIPFPGELRLTAVTLPRPTPLAAPPLVMEPPSPLLDLFLLDDDEAFFWSFSSD